MSEAELKVSLSEEAKEALYQEFIVIANEAIETATKNVTVNNRYLNQKQLMQYMRCGTEQIRTWEAQGLKFFMKGKEKIYDTKDLEQFFDQQKI